MVVSTKSSQLFLRKAFGKEEVIIIGYPQLVSSLSIDPSLNSPTHDIYVVTTDDIKGKRGIDEFKSAVANKHPNAKILYISRKVKGDFIQPTDIGIDGYLVNPKGNELRDEVIKIIQTDSVAAVAEIQEREYDSSYGSGSGYDNGDSVYTEIEDTHNSIPEFNQSDYYVEEEEIIEEEETVEEPVQELDIPVEEEVEEPIEEPADEIESRLLERLHNARTVANVDAYMHELTASVLIKDMLKSNSTYAAIEERLKSLKNAIFDIMADDRNYKTLSQKLSAARAITHDNAFLGGKSVTLLWQRLEEIVDIISDKTNEALNKELKTIETGIKQIKTNSELDAGNARLGGLNQRRVNLSLELLQLQNEINSIYDSCDDLLKDMSGKFGEKSYNLTDDLELNAKIKSHGDTLVSDETLAAIRAIYDYSETKLEPRFKDMLRKVVVMTRLYEEILDNDRETIAAYQATINYLKYINAEDYINEDTLLKKSMRVFTGEEGVGRTIVPYLISSYWSRQNYNVLVFDITGTGKYDMYDVLVRTPEQFMIDLNQEHLCVVSGDIPNTMATAQRIVTTLTKAADYYRVINIVIRPDQKELFDFICREVRSINYIVEPSPTSINRTKDLIESSNYENTAQRVIVNKCNIPVAPIVNKLGLDDNKDIQIVTIPTIDEVTDASIRRFNPNSISSVSIIMEDVLKYVKS